MCPHILLHASLASPCHRCRRKSEDGLETTDAFITRQGGYIFFFAALLQVDHSAPPEAIERAWGWFARLLNRLPANRVTATAILSFLKSAGFRLYGSYGRQFHKLLVLISGEFLRRLEGAGDQDVRAAHTRIRSYLDDREFLEQPEGRVMPMEDQSSLIRA